jgi:Rha family phage regulatory protein
MATKFKKEETDDIADVVEVTLDENGQAIVTSLELSSGFGVSHGEVLTKISSALETGNTQFTERHFGVLGKGSAAKSKPMMWMSRDGFALIASCFTEPKHLQVKISYLTAFAKIEAGKTATAPKAAEPDNKSRPWPQEVEDHLKKKWHFSSKDTHMLGIQFTHITSRIPAILNKFAMESIAQLFVTDFMQSLGETKHDLTVVTPSNRYAMALEVLGRCASARVQAINESSYRTTGKVM